MPEIWTYHSNSPIKVLIEASALKALVGLALIKRKRTSIENFFERQFVLLGPLCQVVGCVFLSSFLVAFVVVVKLFWMLSNSDFVVKELKAPHFVG